MTKLLENALHKTIHSLPEVVKPTLRPIYRHATKFGFIRDLFWGKTGSWRCHEYWRNPYLTNDKPLAYLTEVNDERADYMAEYVRKYSNRENRILEIGCNVGRNLSKLHEYGYLNLSGVEICGEALGLMKVKYPDLAYDAKTYHTAIEHFFENIPDGYYDLVYTMAVLEHMHPDSDWIYPQIARITKNTIITVEDEMSVSWKTFPRNYREYFEFGDIVQVEKESKICRKLSGLSPTFTTRVFMHTDTPHYRSKYLRDCMATKGMW